MVCNEFITIACLVEQSFITFPIANRKSNVFPLFQLIYSFRVEAHVFSLPLECRNYNSYIQCVFTHYLEKKPVNSFNHQNQAFRKNKTFQPQESSVAFFTLTILFSFRILVAAQNSQTYTFSLFSFFFLHSSVFSFYALGCNLKFYFSFIYYLCVWDTVHMQRSGELVVGFYGMNFGTQSRVFTFAIKCFYLMNHHSPGCPPLLSKDIWAKPPCAFLRITQIEDRRSQPVLSAASSCESQGNR